MHSRLLVRHPGTLKRLRHEIDSTMARSSAPTRSDIRKMPYLSLVIKESKLNFPSYLLYVKLLIIRLGLRLYPPVPLNNREAARTTILPTGGGPDGTSPILVRKGEL